MPTKKSAKGQYTVLKAIYVVFLGLIIALFCGLGVAAFYQQPKGPKEPEATPQTVDQKQGLVVNQAEVNYQNEYRKYEEEKLKPYNRNVSIITLALATLILVISLLLSNKLPILSDGILLGAVFTLIYSIIRGISAGNPRFTFIIVSIGLVITVFIGFWKFLRKPKSK
jgi:preprotein translocase subunit SecG